MGSPSWYKTQFLLQLVYNHPQFPVFDGLRDDNSSLGEVEDHAVLGVEELRVLRVLRVCNLCTEWSSFLGQRLCVLCVEICTPSLLSPLEGKFQNKTSTEPMTQEIAVDVVHKMCYVQ